MDAIFDYIISCIQDKETKKVLLYGAILINSFKIACKNEI